MSPLPASPAQLCDGAALRAPAQPLGGPSLQGVASREPGCTADPRDPVVLGINLYFREDLACSQEHPPLTPLGWGLPPIFPAPSMSLMGQPSEVVAIGQFEHRFCF